MSRPASIARSVDIVTAAGPAVGWQSKLLVCPPEHFFFCIHRIALDVLVAGIPDFRQRVAIGLEGHIGLPLAGRIPIGGLTLEQAQARISGELASKLYRQFTADGREISHLILGSEVVVEVSEYSPVYVSGDVSKPGAYPFRPGLTVRQAIAVAGGINPGTGARHRSGSAGE